MGELGGGTRVVVIACHGYGMDVARFGERFAQAPPGVGVLCAEGLSRFYWGGFDGPPVASWMTRAERLQEIDDFCEWLDQVLALATAAAPTARLYGFGFSQGAATVLRWAHRSRPPLAGIILWSGTPPEDIDYLPSDYFSRLTRLAYWGDADELVPWTRAADRFREVPIAFEHRRFVGGHQLPRPPLFALLSELVGA